MANSTEDLVFKNLNADDIDHTVTEIESCCMNCYKNVSVVHWFWSGTFFVCEKKRNFSFIFI